MNIWLSDQWLLECDQELQRSTVQFTTQTTVRQWILFITASMDNHDDEKRRERSGKSEAGVN